MRKTILLFKLIFLSIFLNAQNITLTELQNLCNSNWSTVTNTLTKKGWKYHRSENDNVYSTIVYSYNKDLDCNDWASAWFIMNIFNDKLEQIHYSPRISGNTVNGIIASLATCGFKQTDKKITDNYISTTYENSHFILEIRTSGTESRYYDSKNATNDIILTKKNGAFDKKARATDTRCFSPPDNSFGRL